MTADVAIVGGGIVGCFAAHLAARSHPDWRVILLERTAIGAGATGWSAGVSFPLAATPGHRALVRESAAGYAAIMDDLGERCARPVPMMYVLTQGQAETLQERLVDAVLRPASSQEAADVARMLPDLQLAADEVLVTHDGFGFALDAAKVAQALVADANGVVEVALGQTVQAVERDGDTYRLFTGAGEWSARRVIAATGPWQLPAVRPLALAEPSGARRKRVAALHVALPVTASDPLVYFLADDLFILPLSEGTALASFYRDEWDTDPDTVDGTPTDDDIESGVRVLRRRSPAAAEAVIGGRAFCDLYTDQRLPVVTSDPALPGLAAVRGGSGSGVRLAPGLAAEALRAVDLRTSSMA